MTNARQSTRHVIQHRFEVPAPEPYGADWSDMSVAISWAQQKAQELGKDMHADDWCATHVEDELVVLVVTEHRELGTEQ